MIKSCAPCLNLMNVRDDEPRALYGHRNWAAFYFIPEPNNSRQLMLKTSAMYYMSLKQAL